MQRNLKYGKTPNASNGITLVALVITIIVLLILAGVAINMAVDSDGLFGKANEAAEGWNTAARNEQTAITNLLEMANSIGGTTGDEDGDGNDNDDPPTLPTGWDATKVSAVVTEGTRKAPIPEGFVASQVTAGEDGKGAENTISVGLVIYQGTAPVTGTAGSEAHTTAMTTRNQFVWIPVDDVNQMVMCKKNNKEEGSYVENGETITTKICKLELVKNEETKKEELVCKTHNNSTDLCGRLYGTDTNTSTTPYTTSMNFADRTQTWSDTGYREPAVLGSSYDNDANTDNLATFTTQMTNDFINMVASVAKYGGFYVSRYEAGVNGASLKNQVVITATSSDSTVRKGVSKWYGLYKTAKASTAVDKTAVSTHMIYGSQYDQIINFIGAEAQKGHSANEVVTSQSKTGTKPEDRLNNIFDLEGNNSEWTAQAYVTDGRVCRGGEYSSASNYSFYPASGRTYNIPTNTNSYYTTRLSLYL